MTQWWLKWYFELYLSYNSHSDITYSGWQSFDSPQDQIKSLFSALVCYCSCTASQFSGSYLSPFIHLRTLWGSVSRSINSFLFNIEYSALYIGGSQYLYDEWRLVLNKLFETENRIIILVLPSLFESPRCLSFYAANIIFNLELVPQSLLPALTKDEVKLRARVGTLFQIRLPSPWLARDSLPSKPVVKCWAPGQQIRSAIYILLCELNALRGYDIITMANIKC